MGSIPMAATRLLFSSVGRARNYTFVAGYVILLIIICKYMNDDTIVEDESYFSLLSSGSWVRVPPGTHMGRSSKWF